MDKTVKPQKKPDEKLVGLAARKNEANQNDNEV